MCGHVPLHVGEYAGQCIPQFPPVYSKLKCVADSQKDPSGAECRTRAAAQVVSLAGPVPAGLDPHPHSRVGIRPRAHPGAPPARPWGWQPSCSSHPQPPRKPLGIQRHTPPHLETRPPIHSPPSTPLPCNSHTKMLFLAWNIRRLLQMQIHCREVLSHYRLLNNWASPPQNGN